MVGVGRGAAGLGVGRGQNGVRANCHRPAFEGGASRTCARAPVLHLRRNECVQGSTDASSHVLMTVAMASVAGVSFNACSAARTCPTTC